MLTFFIVQNVFTGNNIFVIICNNEINPKVA